MSINKLSQPEISYTLIDRDGITYNRDIASNSQIVDPVSNMPGVLVAAPSHGARTIIPRNDFIGAVYMWGAGAGIYSTYTSSYNTGGYGGYTWGIMKFRKNVPYTIITGQKGTQNISSLNTIGPVQGGRAFGGGGRGWSSGSGGGGLSGIFYNAQHNGGPNYSTWPLEGTTQAKALLIAGGGGGGGHGSNTHHGIGGGGGGWNGNMGHNSSMATQIVGGNPNYAGSSGTALQGGDSSTQTTVGGGGGGWWGGAGGGHSGSHYNGGGGGSGHYVNSGSSGGNTSLTNEVLFAETVPSHVDYSNNYTQTAGSNQSFFKPGGFYLQKPSPIYNMGAGYGSLSGDIHQTDGNVVIALLPNAIMNALGQSPSNF
jgi:hypothetical protein